MNIYIDSEKLKDEIEKFKALNTDMNILFSNIKKETETLKEYWDTKTSLNVFNEFSNFYNDLENIKSKNDEYINFLNNVVNSSYLESNEITNKLIDEKISIE